MRTGDMDANGEPPKKRSKRCKERCIICDEVLNPKSKDNPTVQNPTYIGMKAIVDAAEKRQDSVNERLAEIKSDVLKQKTIIRYHRNCKASYTSIGNLKHVISKASAAETFNMCDIRNTNEEQILRGSRSKTYDFNVRTDCFICGKSNKRKAVLTKISVGDGSTTRERVLAAAAQRCDEVVRMCMLAYPDLFAYDGKYHKVCYSTYISHRNINAARKQHNTDNIYDKAVLSLSDEIQSTVLSKSQDIVTLSSLHERFLEILAKQSEGINHIPQMFDAYPSWKLKQKLRKIFTDKLLFISQEGKTDLVCSSTITVGYALKKIAALSAHINNQGGYDFSCSQSTDGDASEGNEDVILHKAAGILRDSISGIIFNSSHYIPSKYFNVKQCKSFVPDMLSKFVLWCTSKHHFDKALNLDSDNCNDMKVLGICHSIMSLSCKIQTPITFGLGVHTHHNFGSKELIDILSSLGFSINYDEVRKFNTSVAVDQHSCPSDVYIPRGISKVVDDNNPRSIVDAAIDNFDRNEETLDGKHTTHSMAVVLYQRSHVPEEDLSIPRRKQKSLDSTHCVEENIKWYRKPPKKPNPTIAFSSVDHEDSNKLTIKLNITDLIWSVARAYADENSSIPAWSGFNSLVSTAVLPAVTTIRYLPFINAPPSDFSTIYTTLLKLMRIAEELGQNHMLVTADLAIYSKAQLILWSNPEPLFGKITMRLGGMHLIMAYIASIGKLFGDGGLLNILVCPDVYASATANQMLQGKQYARGIRGIRLVHEALLHMYFASAEAFAQKNDLPWMSTHFKNSLCELETAFSSRDPINCAATCQELEKKIPHSVLYTLELFQMSGCKNSATFGYWYQFLECGNLLLKLLRADREANFLMHLEAVMEAVPYFILAGRVNYARYAPVYVTEMRQLATTQPNMFQHLINGGFVVRHTDKRIFNSVPTDQALEQSINREAKGRGGIVGFTLRKGALLRWMLTRHVTGEYSEAFKEMCQGSLNDKPHDELGKSRLQRDRCDVNCIKEYISNQCQNPFDIDNVSKSLVNITTGQVASKEVERSLMGIPDKGQSICNDFIQHQFGDEASRSFWEPIKKNVTLTFSDMKKSLTHDKQRKVIMDTEVLFRRLLAVSQSRDTDLKMVLTYELAAVSPSLFHDDGSMRKGAKSDLSAKLEENCQEVLNELPRPTVMHTASSSAYIIDGMAMLQGLNENQFRTFDDLAVVILKRLIHLLKDPKLDLGSVTVIFDRYDVKTSIKGLERQRRDGTNLSQTHHIQGNRLVPNYREFLKGGGNKSSLADFVSQYVLNHAQEQLPEGKSVVLAGGFSSGKLVMVVRESGVSECDVLRSNQEEADTRIVLHAVSLSNDYERLIVCCDDTDVLVILAYTYSKGLLAHQVYMYKGHSGKERYIPVHEIVKKLGSDACECLPAIHALTGCDTTCSLNRIGKKTAYSTLLKNLDGLLGLKQFHEEEDDVCLKVARKFTLLMYGNKGKGVDSLNDLRYVFATTTDKLATMFPPTEDAFKQHVLRAKYQCKLWCESHIANPELVSPVGRGWSACENGGIIPTMYTQESAPVELRDLTHLYCKDNNCTDGRRCPCDFAGLGCIALCKCTGCRNKNNERKEDEAELEEEREILSNC